MLYIGRKHMEEVIDLAAIMDCIERAYEVYEGGDFQMPDRMHVDRPEGTILYMPCFAGAVSGTKIVSTFPGNVVSGIPTIQGTMILNDCATGEALAVMDGAMITAYRTGAVGGVAVRYTTRPDAGSAGLIGAGVQGKFQLLYACRARAIRDVHIFDTDIARRDRLRDELAGLLDGVRVHAAKDARTLVGSSDIIITATPATVPVLPDDEDFLRGRHYIAIGSYKYEMRELPPALYRVLDAVYIDTELALSESGDLIVPMEQGWLRREDCVPLGRVLKSLQGEPVEVPETTLFKSVGMGLFDLIVAEEIYKAALKKGTGIELGE